MRSTAPKIDGDNAVFTLATGEVVRVSIRESGLGLMGYRLNVNTDRGTVLVIPSSGNSIDVMTPRSLEAEQSEGRRIVAEREASKATGSAA